MRSILQFGLMVLLLSAENRLWGKVAFGQQISERGFVESGVFVGVVDTPPVLMSSGALAASGANQQPSRMVQCFTMKLGASFAMKLRASSSALSSISGSSRPTVCSGRGT